MWQRYKGTEYIKQELGKRSEGSTTAVTNQSKAALLNVKTALLKVKSALL